MPSEILTQEYVKQLFTYNPDTGDLIWNKRPLAKRVGKIAGTKQKIIKGGKYYIYLKINGNKHLSHRIIWLHQYGNYPINDIDHIDGNGCNNRLSNLRDVSALTNAQNASKRSDNTSGVIGVRFTNNRWYATINVDNTRHHLGSFVKFSDAVNARKNAEVLYNFYGKD